MKRNKFFAFVSAAAVVLSIATVGMITSCDHDNPEPTRTVAEGRCVVNGDSYLIIEGNAPVSMDNKGNRDMFDGLTTGDLIRIVRDDEVRESYPGQVGVYECTKLEDGSPNDIPDDIRQTLTEFGWMKDDAGAESENSAGSSDKTSNQIHESVSTVIASYEYKFANMSLRVPEGWEYDICEYNDECSYFGIKVWPEYKDDSRLELMYHTGMFGVCGTGLTQEKTTLGGIEANKGTYGGKFWSFIATDDYALYNYMPDATYELYRDDIELILSSVKIADGIMTEEEAVSISAERLNLPSTYAYGRFNYDSGVWAVSIYMDKEHSILAAKTEVDASGKVVFEEQYTLVN